MHLKTRVFLPSVEIVPNTQALIVVFLCRENILLTALFVSEAASSSLYNPGYVEGISDKEKAEKTTPSRDYFTKKLQVNSMVL